MPANNVRLGGAYFTFTADARPYEAGANRAIAANQRLAASYGRFAVQLQGTQVLANQFAQSLRSSLLATAAYAAGVGLVSATLRNVVGGFLAYDRALIQISKTTDISGEALERLGVRIQALGTGPSGLRPALPVLREDLFAIATAAGQAGVQTSRGIEQITRAAAELQVSSNLIGSDAVRALTRYLQVTGQTLDRTDAIASAYTHLGNNIVGTEAEIASFATRVAQNLSAVGRSTDEFILGVSATLVELGVQQEAAGSALQRTQIALLRLAEDPDRFHAFADAIGGTADEVEELRRRFVEGTASARDFDRVFLAFLRRVRETGPTQRQSFIADIIGGGEANVRNTRVIGVLAQRLERLRRNQELAAEATEQANFHTKEATRAAEAQSSALQIVGNQLEAQATAIGRHVTPALIFAAENFRFLEVAAAAAATAFVAGFGARRVRSIRETTREIREQTTATQAAARAEALRTRQVAVARVQQLNALRAQRAADPASVSTTVVAQATRRYENASARAATAARNLVSANEAVAATARTAAQRMRAFGASAVALAGGPIGVLLAAVSAAATAWLLFGNRTDEAEERLRSLRDEAEQTITAVENAGLTQQGDLIRRLEEERGRQEERIAALREYRDNQGRSLEDITPAQAARTGLQARLSELRGRERIVSELTDQINSLRESLGATEEAATDMVTAAAQSFERLAPSLLPARQAVRAFRVSLEDAARADLERARAEQDAAGLSVVAGRTAIAIAEQRARITAYRLRLGDQLRNLEERELDQSARVRELTARRDELAVGSKARQEAERQLQVEETRLRTIRDQTEAIAVQQRRSIGIRTTDQEIEEIERVRRAIELRRRLDREPQQQPVAAAFQSDERVIDIERRLSEIRRRSAVDAEARAASSAREEAAIRARARVIGEYEAAERQAADAVALTTRRLEEARQTRDGLATALRRTFAITGDLTEAQLDQLDAAKRLVATLRGEREGQLLTAEALRASEGAYQALADAAVEAARAEDEAADRRRIRQQPGAVTVDRFAEQERAAGRLAAQLRELTANQEESALRRAAGTGREAMALLAAAQVQQDYNRLVAEASETLETTADRLARVRFARDALAASLERQLDAGEDITDQQIRELDALKQQAAALEADLTLSRDAVTALNERASAYGRLAAASAAFARSEDEAEDRRRLALPATPVAADTLAEQQRVADDLRQQQQQLARDVEEAAIRRVAASEREAEALLAANNVQRRYIDLLDAAELALARTENRLSRARTERDALAATLESELDAGRDVTDQQLSRLRSLDREVESQRAAVTERRAAVAALRAEAGGYAEVAAARAAFVRAQEAELDRQRLRREPAPQQADARFRFDEAALELRQRQRQLSREAEVEAEARLATSAREEAAIRASLPILHEYNERQQQQAEAIALTNRRLRQAVQARDELNAYLEFSLRAGRDLTDAELDLLDAAKRRVATLQAERAEQLLTAEALRESAGVYQELANAQAAAAREVHRGPLDEIADQASRLNDSLERVAAGGFNSLADELANLVTTGKANFTDLANSIISDLLRVLIQAQVVAPLVQALTGGGGLFGGGGGLGGLLGGLFGFHEGGVSPHAPQRLQRQRGLRADEMFAVLLRGEVVVPRELARRARYGGPAGMDELRQWISRLPRFHSGGVAGGGGFRDGPGGGGTRIELINQTNRQIEAVDNGTRVDGADYVRTVILRDTRANGPITRSLAMALRGN